MLLPTRKLRQHKNIKNDQHATLLSTTTPQIQALRVWPESGREHQSEQHNEPPVACSEKQWWITAYGN